MAIVFLATDLKHHRRVAIKVLKPELATALGADRFLREIEIASSLNHPHILPLFDSGEADGLLYFVAPFIEGQSLRDRLNAEHQLPVEEAVELTRQVAAALAYAHGRGLLHRDIKPENILLAQGEAVVADFGIARAVEEAAERRLTQTGIVIGTPAYMSPEQGTGTPVDARSDLYSLACVLYELLAGQPPFTSPTAHALLAQHSLDQVPSIRAARPAVPPALEAVIGRALAKLPADRFQSVAEFSAALAAAVPGGVRPVGLPHADQQRRNLCQHHRHHHQGCGLVCQLWHREEQGHQGLCPHRQDHQQRPHRGADGHPAPPDRRGNGRRRTGRPQGQGRPDGRPLGGLHPCPAPRHPGGL